MKMDSITLTVIGILLIVVGWFTIFSGIFGILQAEDTLVLSFRLESLVLDTSYIPASHFIFHMSIRIIFGIFIVVFGNEFLVRGLNKCHHGICHPRITKLRRLR